METIINAQIPEFKVQAFQKGDELVRKVSAAQFVESHPGEVCPAKWKQGEETLKPSIDLVGKL